MIGMRIRPRADQRVCLEIAQNMHKGNFEAFTKEGYLQAYPQQAGLILLYYFVSFFLGSATVIGLQLMNVFAYICFIYCIYHITVLLWKNTTVAAVAAVITFSFLPLLFYTTFVYGTLPGLALSSLAMLKALQFIRKQRTSAAIQCSIFAACSIVIKKNFLIPAVAIMLIMALYGICKRQHRAFLCILFLLGATFSLNTMTSMTLSSISGYSLGKGMPSIAWVTMGFQKGFRADGWYNQYTINTYVDNDFDTEATARQAKKDLHKELRYFYHNKLDAASFFYKKTISQWGEPTFECFFITNTKTSFGERDLSAPPFITWLIIRVFIPFFDLFLSMTLIGVMMYLLYYRKHIGLWELLLPISFLGGFLFHLAWEAKGQYTITYFVLLFPYCAKGYYAIYRSLQGVLTNTKSTAENTALNKHSLPCLAHAVKPLIQVSIILLVLNTFCLAIPKVNAIFKNYNQTYEKYLYEIKPKKKSKRVPTGNFTILAWDKELYLDYSLKGSDHSPVVYLNKNKSKTNIVSIKKEDRHISFKFAKASFSFNDMVLPKLHENEVKKETLFYSSKGDWSLKKNNDGSYIITNPEGFVLARTKDDHIVFEPYKKSNSLQKWKLHRISN
ncbi:MAG: hypothetical protein Q4F05_15575 [bacterium]|nr:hypothetical protein [bacterium]